MSPESEIIQHAAAEFIRDRHRLGAFVNGLLRDAHLAEDVLQEVWVRLAAEVAKGKRLENQAAWCRGVARNLVRRHWEQQQSARVVADSAVLETFLDRVELAFAEVDDAHADWTTRQQALDECVAALPERSRQMLTLRYESRASMHEVARAMGQTFESVTKTLYRVRRALLECVERKVSRI
jgi:RNA polymerase sigma-70 factor (ECF subfamily)